MEQDYELKTIDVGAIKVGSRARESFDDIDILAESIKRDGLIQPLAVKWDESSLELTLLAGERRLRACIVAGLLRIPVRIYAAGISILQQKSIELQENLNRKKLHYAEEAKLITEINTLQVEIHGQKDRWSTEGWSQKETAKLVGISQTHVSKQIKLAERIEENPELGEQG